MPLLPFARLRYRLLTAVLALCAALVMVSCSQEGAASTPTPVVQPTDTVVPTDTAAPEPTATATPQGTATPAPIPVSERGFVPILCYHHIRDWRKSDTEDDRGYIVPPAKLEAQLKYLKENGYHSVVSRDVYEYYANGRPLPDKPIMLSFDDSDDNQFTLARPLLLKYGFNATFFIMTVTMDRENYMTTDQIKQLDKEGFDIQPHTWDHHIVTKYATEEDWQKQIVEPRKTIESLLGHETPFFAYPFGIYNASAAEKLKSYGYKAAFRLREVMDKGADPLFAIPRYIANGYWTMHQFELAVQGNW